MHATRIPHPLPPGKPAVLILSLQQHQLLLQALDFDVQAQALWGLSRALLGVGA